MSLSYVIPTVHPSFVLRQGKPIVQEIGLDLAKAARIAAGDGPNWHEYLLPVLPSVQLEDGTGGTEAVVRRALAWMRKWQAQKCPISFDVETDSLWFMANRLWSMGLSGLDGYNVGIAFTLCDLHTLPWDAEQALVACLRKILLDPDIVKVGHNLPYDMAVCENKGLPVRGRVYDTQGLHHLWQPDVPHDLGWVGQTILDCDAWKLDEDGNKMAFERDALRLLTYNAKDAVRTGACVNPLLDAIHERGMDDRLISYQMAMTQLATRMELHGLPLDMALRERLGKQIEDGLVVALATMREFLNWPDFDPNKKNHVVDALYGPVSKGRLGLTPTNYTKKTRAPSSSHKDLVDHLHHPFVALFVDYMENRTLHSTLYRNQDAKGKLTNFAGHIHADNRMHYKCNPNGTKGARLATQPNVQNIRNSSKLGDNVVNHRSWFRAPDGYVFVGSDKDQLELRILACRAGAAKLIEEIRKPDGDPHTLAARVAYGNEFEQASKQTRKDMRTGTKNTVYASLYLAGVDVTYRTVRSSKYVPIGIRAALTPNDVRRVQKGFFGQIAPEIIEYHNKNLRICSNPPYQIAVEPFGRVRFCPVQPPPFTEIGNWPTQEEGAGHVMKEAVELQDDLDRKFPGAQICLIVHDQVITECKESQAEGVRELTDKHFGKTRIEGPAGAVFLTATAKIGKSLADVK